MIMNSKRAFIASLSLAVIGTTSFAGAQSTRPVLSTPLVRGPLTAGADVRGARPFANGTPRTRFVAGGATLPAIAYVGTAALSQNPSLPYNGSIFGYFQQLTGVAVQYCQTGSGFGKRLFDDDKTTVTGGVNAPCAALGTSSGATNGFGAPSSLGLSDPDITGTDSPLVQAEYSNFETWKGFSRGEPVQLPSVIGSVALFYNNPDLGTTQLNLLDYQVCQIVQGKITNWSQLGKPARPLLFAYRSDGSGTTFSFSNHLVSVCGVTTLNVSQNFASPTGAAGTFVIGNKIPPASFGGFAGNPGVIAGVSANVGSIGYVEAGNARFAVQSGRIGFAKVNGYDPIKDLPQTAALLNYSGSVLNDSAVVTNGGAATTTPLTGVKKAGCVKLVAPSAYANITTRGHGYPIVAVTNFLFSTNGNGSTNAGHLRTLVSEINTPSSFGSHITSVNPATTTPGTGVSGFAALGSSFNAPLISAAASCIGT